MRRTNATLKKVCGILVYLLRQGRRAAHDGVVKRHFRPPQFA